MLTEINAQVQLGYKTTNLTIKQVGSVNLLLGKDAIKLFYINTAIEEFAKDKHELSVVRITDSSMPFYDKLMSKLRVVN